MSYEPTKLRKFGTIGELSQFLEEEFRKVSITLNSAVLEAGELFVEPSRPRVAMLAFADGTEWDPGDGRGFYYFDSLDNLWHLLGSGGGGGSYTDEQVRDVVTALLVAGLHIRLLSDDPGDSLTIAFQPQGVAYDAGTLSSGTFIPDSENGVYQKAALDGDFVFTVPAFIDAYDSVVLHLKGVNTDSPGAIDTDDYDAVTGDELTLTEGDVFHFDITSIADTHHLHITAMGNIFGFLLMEDDGATVELEDGSGYLLLG
jgi:hypothetical protein